MSYIRRDPLRAVTDDECEEKGAIEQAYTVGELVGLPVWCEDEARPFQAIPQPGGNWLNMAESVQRIIIRRAISGQHYRSAGELMAALEAATRGWNAYPTPFVWGGKRQERRLSARQRRHALGGSAPYTRKPLVTRGNCTLRETA